MGFPDVAMLESFLIRNHAKSLLPGEIRQFLVLILIPGFFIIIYFGFFSSRRALNEGIVGWVYECPSYLAFDPVGGRCNWATDFACSK